jgi:hypothetical protein
VYAFPLHPLPHASKTHAVPNTLSHSVLAAPAGVSTVGGGDGGGSGGGSGSGGGCGGGDAHPVLNPALAKRALQLTVRRVLIRNKTNVTSKQLITRMQRHVLVNDRLVSLVRLVVCKKIDGYRLSSFKQQRNVPPNCAATTQTPLLPLTRRCADDSLG